MITNAGVEYEPCRADCRREFVRAHPIDELGLFGGGGRGEKFGRVGVVVVVVAAAAAAKRSLDTARWPHTSKLRKFHEKMASPLPCSLRTACEVNEPPSCVFPWKQRIHSRSTGRLAALLGRRKTRNDGNTPLPFQRDCQTTHTMVASDDPKPASISRSPWHPGVKPCSILS